AKGMKQQNLVQLLQAMASPLGQAAMGQINAVNFFRGIFREFEVPNINEIFQTNPQLLALQQQASQGMGLQGVPTSGQLVQGAQVPGAPAGPPPGLGAGAGMRGVPLGKLPGMLNEQTMPASMLSPGVAA